MKILVTLKKIIRFIAQILRRVFGEISWAAPKWLKVVFSKTKTTYLKNPKQFWTKCLGSLAVLSLCVGGWYWWQNRPKPQYCAINANNIYPPSFYSKKSSSLTLSFSCSAAPLEAINQEVTEGIQISPEMKGTWRWTSDRILNFEPSGTYLDQDWKANEKYTVKLAKKLISGNIVVESYSINFTPNALDASVQDFSFAVDAKNPSLRRVAGAVHFNWPIDSESFRKNTTLLFNKVSGPLSQSEVEIPAIISFNDTFTEAYVSSENLPVPELESTVKLKIKKGFGLLSGAVSSKKFFKSTKVPGRRGSFKINRSHVVYARNDRFEPEQILNIESSLEVASEEVGKRAKIWLLPAKEFPNDKYDHVWTSFAEVSPAVIARSEKVEFTTIPSETPLTKSHALKINGTVPFQRYLYVEIAGDLKAFGDYELGDGYHNTTVVPSSPKEVKIQGQGILLSLDGEKKISVASRGVRDVVVEVSKVLPAQINQLIRTLNYSNMSELQLYQGSSDTFSEVFSKPITLANINPTKTEYFSIDMEEFLTRGHSQKGLFYIRIKEKDGRVYDQRLILLTRLGFIAKKSSTDSYDVFVQDLKSGLAIQGASVEVIGANGLAAFSTVSDASGKAEIPSLKDLDRERQPIAIAVRQGESLSFVPINPTEDRFLQTSRFDTGGVQESSESDALTAMLFSDRGIYRPGESVKIGMIIRSRNIKFAKSEIPLRWVVTDSKGTKVANNSISVSTGNLFEVDISTRPESSTGTWNIELLSAEKNTYNRTVGSTSFRVEEFQPDRMKISSSFSRSIADGWTAPTDLKAQVVLKNLFGTPAQDRRIVASYSLSPITPNFKKYKDYSFSPLHGKNDRYIQTPLNDKKTDSEGKASFDLDLNAVGSGLYSLRFEGEGFENEEGGRSVVSSSRILVSNLPYLVGVKRDGDLNYINVDAERKIHLLAIGPSLEGMDVNDVSLNLIEKKYVSALIRDSNGAYKYQSIQREMPLKSSTKKIPAKGLNVDLDTGKPGDFVLVVKTLDGIELNKIEYSVAGNAIQLGRMDRNAELQLKLSKSDYKPGENIELEIRAPYEGRGLITIERDQVYAHKWFRSSGAKSIESIAVPEGLEGNAYVSVSFLRDINSKEIYMSPLSYAIAPFSLARDSFETKVSIDAPERVRPGEKLSIKYSTSRPSDLLLWGVDEGILQVAKYSAPSPLDFFLKKRALQVRTLQILDLLMPEYSIIKELLSPGGDGDAEAALGKNLNPFRRKGQDPIVFWSGVLKADSRKQVYEYNVPDYFNGSIRILGLASSSSGMGTQTASTTVKGDLILTPTAPLAAGHGDIFEMSVGVSNQTEGSGQDADVQVSVEAPPAFELMSEATTTLKISEGDEKSQSFKIKTKESFGAKKIKITAKTKGSKGVKEAHYDVEVSIRPLTPYLHHEEFRLSDSLPQSFELPELYEVLNKSQVLVSNNPLDLGEALGNYLYGFPYGCTEQILSRAIAQMVLKSRFGSTTAKAPTAKDGFMSALSQLQTRQQDDGGFALYPGQSSQLLSSVWTLQYLIEADKRGLRAGQTLLDQAINYAYELKFEPNMSNEDARWTSLGIYLVASTGKVPTANLAEFEENLIKKRKDMEYDLATVFLAGTYKLLKQDARANALLDKIEFDSPVLEAPYYAYNTMARNAALLMIAARHFPEKQKDLLNQKSLQQMLEPLQKGQVQTLSAGLTLLALDAVGRAASQNPASEFKNKDSSQTLRNQKKEDLDFHRVDTGAYIASILPNAKEITVNGTSASMLFSYVQTSGFEAGKDLKEIKQGIEVQRIFLDETGKPAGNEIRQGSTLTVVLRVRSLKGSISNVAVVDLLPSGFEIQLDSGASSGSYDYIDRREDRVVAYLNAGEGSSEYRYNIKAVSRGEFTVPPIFAEALYNRETKYRGEASKIVVSKP